MDRRGLPDLFGDQGVALRQLDALGRVGPGGRGAEAGSARRVLGGADAAVGQAEGGAVLSGAAAAVHRPGDFSRAANVDSRGDIDGAGVLHIDRIRLARAPGGACDRKIWRYQQHEPAARSYRGHRSPGLCNAGAEIQSRLAASMTKGKCMRLIVAMAVLWIGLGQAGEAAQASASRLVHRFLGVEISPNGELVASVEGDSSASGGAPPGPDLGIQQVTAGTTITVPHPFRPPPPRLADVPHLAPPVH